MIRSIQGRHGKIVNPAVGLLIGEMTSWSLEARKDVGPEQGLYVFRASFSTLIDWLFNDPAVPHQIVIEVGRGQQYRLEQTDVSRTVLEGLSLLIEGVNLWRLEQP